MYFYFEGNEKCSVSEQRDKSPGDTPPEFRNPTVEQLAGVNIRIEGNEVIYLNGGSPKPEPK